MCKSAYKYLWGSGQPDPSPALKDAQSQVLAVSASPGIPFYQIFLQHRIILFSYEYHSASHH